MATNYDNPSDFPDIIHFFPDSSYESLVSCRRSTERLSNLIKESLEFRLDAKGRGRDGKDSDGPGISFAND